jgi:Lipocalin-like domain
LFLALLSCSKDSKKEELIPAYVGKWQLIEVAISSGGPTPPYVKIEDGYFLTLNSDSSYMNTDFQECNSGTYSVTDNVISYVYSSGNTTIPNKFRIYSNTINELVVSNINCDEACLEKFKKIE